jgi:phage recombination protein Bet
MSFSVLQNSDLDIQIELARRTSFKDLSKDEWSTFLYTCRNVGLSPLPCMKQMYAIKRKGSITIQTSIDGYRLIADRTGRYMPGKEPTFSYGKDGELISATAYVKKMDCNGQWHEIASIAFFDEYAVYITDRDTGKRRLSEFWDKMGHSQLAKCAETLGIRKGWPAEMSSLRTQEEMEQSNSVPDVEEAIEDGPRVIAKEMADYLKSLLDTDDEKEQEYKNRLLRFYKINDFYELEERHYESLIRAIRKHHDNKSQECLMVGA